MSSYKIGMYLRLSKDDGKEKAESDSIGSQRLIIQNYIKANLTAESITEYVDDGYTGLNFERPDFQKMVVAVTAGEIDCIIVKDLSRFGRDYLGTGQYIFNDFVLKGVRFIAVNDGYDSLNSNGSDSFMMPMKTMLNNYYSMDISNKVQGTFRAMQQEGKFTGGFASYGYKRDEQDKHKLVIDEGAASIVRMIFDLFIEGQGKQSIARILNSKNIPCPAEYKRLVGSNYRNAKKLDTTYYWTYSTIHNILKNEMYIGNMVLNKNVRVKPRAKAKKNDKEKWIITEGTHEAIISKEKWELVQNLLIKRGRQLSLNNNISIFAGFIVCGDCGRAMSKLKTNWGGTEKTVYVCGSYKRYGKDICGRHEVNEEILSKAILDKLNEYIAKADIIIDSVKTDSSKNTESIKKYKELINIVKGRKKKLFETLSEDLISKEEYKEYKESYDMQEKQYLALIESVEQEEKEENSERMQWIKHLKSKKRIEKLDRSILADTLSKIVVTESEEELKINIQFRFCLD